MRPLPPGSFDQLPPNLGRWLEYEQTVNERLIHEIFLPQRHHRTTVSAGLQPERRPVWKQSVVWLPKGLIRQYGFLETELGASLNLKFPAGRAPLFLHPQATGVHRKLARQYGCERLPSIAATPTASYRSVLAWRADTAQAAVLKLSIGAIIGGRRRGFRENQIARAIVINSLLETIPRAQKRRLGFDWFAEAAGAVETRSGRGWLLRRLPESLRRSGVGSLVPSFSLISKRAGAAPLLVDLIEEARQKPEDFVIEQILTPYVRTLSHLLFVEGLQYEGHTQNVLFEMTPRGTFNGRIVLRDLADTTVNVAFRIATGKTLPIFPDGFLPAGAPFPIAGNAADYRCDFDTPRVVRGLDTVERYGLWGFVWPINTSLARYFPRYNARRVEQIYLELWQQAAIKHLGLRPLFRRKPKGMATDEAFSHFLQAADWRALGARPASLPATAEPLLIEGKMRRRGGRVYEKVESAWGELFLKDGLPGFFRPAF